MKGHHNNPHIYPKNSTTPSLRHWLSHIQGQMLLCGYYCRNDNILFTFRSSIAWCKYFLQNCQKLPTWSLLPQWSILYHEKFIIKPELSGQWHRYVKQFWGQHIKVYFMTYNTQLKNNKQQVKHEFKTKCAQIILHLEAFLCITFNSLYVNNLTLETCVNKEWI